MFTAPQFAHTPPVVTQQSSATGSASALARAYLDYISAYWRGDSDALQMRDRLAAFFRVDMPMEPMRPADAFSPHGARGHGIRWYECSDAVLGYVPGTTSGYRIPRACVVEFGSATVAGLGGSIPLDNPGDSEAGQLKNSEPPVRTSVAHMVSLRSRTAVDAVA